MSIWFFQYDEVIYLNDFVILGSNTVIVYLAIQEFSLSQLFSQLP